MFSKDNLQVAIWKKTEQLCLFKQNLFGSEVIFEVDGKEFRYLQCELGPFSDFEILGDL